MTVYAAKVSEGVVTRVVVLEKGVPDDGFITIGVDNTVGIGWTYVNGEFVPPPYVEEEE